jgi:hypothetical protein
MTECKRDLVYAGHGVIRVSSGASPTRWPDWFEVIFTVFVTQGCLLLLAISASRDVTNTATIGTLGVRVATLVAEHTPIVISWFACLPADWPHAVEWWHHSSVAFIIAQGALLLLIFFALVGDCANSSTIGIAPADV